MSESPLPRKIDEHAEYQLTRELELLISGALVFALLQAPEYLDAWWNRTALNVAGTSFAAPFAAYYAGKIVAYGLIAVIVGHFVIRGFWVALLGLRAAFPGEIDESKLDMGPYQRELYARRDISLSQLEDRVDRVAASLFSFFFLFMFLIAGVVFWAIVSGAVAIGLSRLVGRPGLVAPIFWFLFAVYALVPTSVRLLDKRSKSHELSPFARKFGARAFAFSYFFTLGFLYTPIFMTFATRFRRKTFVAVQVGFLYTMVAIFIVSTFIGVGLIGYDSYEYFPLDGGTSQLRNSSYENLRHQSASTVVPTVQSQLVTDPYVRLFIPYNVRRDNALVREFCGGVAPFRPDGFYISPRNAVPDPARLRSVLECFAEIYTAKLDDTPIDLKQASFYIRPDDQLHGRVVMVPIAQLATGRHTITVTRKRLPDDESKRPREWAIPFWK